MLFKGDRCKKQQKVAEIYHVEVHSIAVSRSDKHLLHLVILVSLKHFGTAEDRNNPVAVLRQG